MKIKITEIEANARELRECNTLGDNLCNLLKRALQSNEPFEDEDTDEENSLDDE